MSTVKRRPLCDQMIFIAQASAAVEVCSPILQVFLSMDNSTAAFDAYEIRLYAVIVQNTPADQKT